MPSYTRNASLFLSIYSNLTQCLRPRHNFSFFNESSPISSSSVLLILGYSWGAVKNICFPGSPPDYLNQSCWGWDSGLCIFKSSGGYNGQPRWRTTILPGHVCSLLWRPRKPCLYLLKTVVIALVVWIKVLWRWSIPTTLPIPRYFWQDSDCPAWIPPVTWNSFSCAG